MAPFEADAELAYLSKSGHVDAVLTEDSDLLAYGCKKVPVSLKNSSINPNIEKVINNSVLLHLDYYGKKNSPG